MKLLRTLGPGILLAATCVGSSHIVMSPEAGARFEYQLLWLIALTHLLKYPAFEFAPRYVAAQRESLLDGYAKVPGRKNWALWFGLIDMVIQASGVLAALIGLAAAFLVVGLGGLGLLGWSVVIAIALLGMLAWGRYASLRWINVILMLALAIGTLVAFLGAPPSPAAIPALVTPAVPEGSILLLAALLGFMPTSVAVSVWQSLWAVEQGRFKPGTPDSPTERRERFRAGLFDLRVGYLLSAVLGVAFMCLGAVLLFPRGLVPEGPEMAVTLSQLYTDVMGEWMRPVFLSVAFFAMFTTCYTSMDGFPRTFVATLRVLRGQRSSSFGESPAGDSAAPTQRPYWLFICTATFGGMALVAAVPDPAMVVKVVGAIGLLTSPVYIGLNLWVVTHLIEDPKLRPSKSMVGLALGGIVLLVLGAGLLVYATVTGA